MQKNKGILESLKKEEKSCEIVHNVRFKVDKGVSDRSSLFLATTVVPRFDCREFRSSRRSHDHSS